MIDAYSYCSATAACLPCQVIKPKMVVVRQGDPAESVLIIRKGQCYVCVDPYAPQVLAHADASSTNNNTSASAAGQASPKAGQQQHASQVQFKNEPSGPSKSEAVGSKSYSLMKDPAAVHVSSSTRKASVAAASSTSSAQHQQNQSTTVLPLEGSVSADTLEHELASVSDASLD